MESAEIESIVERQRKYFATHATFDVQRRKEALRRLQASVQRHEDDIAQALQSDLGKSPEESYLSETGLVLSEIRYLLAHVDAWSRPHARPTNLANAFGSSRVLSVPYGVTLIMSPWNYPFLLTLEPLAGALAAGNCCVVKPSAYSPASSALIRQICSECFPPAAVKVVEGGRAENEALLDQRFDYIFFTGSVAVGRTVMEKAAKNLTPVSLELGGKSPCIVDGSANLEVAARRIAFGKWLNVGQTCVAPDYLLVSRSIKDIFLEELERQIRRMYGNDPLSNPRYGKMVNRKHFDRVLGLVDGDKVVIGGRSDAQALKIEPTVMDGVGADDAVMQEEVFGPVLPVLVYDSLDEAEEFVTSRATPLALYIFTSSKQTADRFMRYVPFGGGCVNDTVMHLATSEMGFGGMGESGIGSYHGRKSFETFSHEKSILRKYAHPDLPMRYQPYKPWKDRVVHMFLR